MNEEEIRKLDEIINDPNTTEETKEACWDLKEKSKRYKNDLEKSYNEIINNL